MTGIICALKIEADGLKQSVENPKIKTVAGLDFIKSIKNIMKNGARVATLGKRILRAETAPRNCPFNSSVKIPASIIW